MKNAGAKIELIAGSVIFGTIGALRKAIPMSSGTLSICRGIIGVATLLIITFAKSEKVDLKAVKRNLKALIFSGFAIGINWILIFDAFNYTSVAVASLCYYTAPIFMIFGSALAYREKITGKNILCIVLTLFGMSLVSGIWTEKLTSDQITGVALSVGAAILYSAGIVTNKSFREIKAVDRTMAQLLFASIAVLPYSVLYEKQIPFDPTFKNILLLFIIGAVHTGLAFFLTFDSIAKLDTKTVAFFTYIDPIVSVIMSALVLKEGISVQVVIGAVFIIGSALYNELKSN